jgi:hypothetical protein
MTGDSLPGRFLAFSAEVTAFTVFDLQGTGQSESYRSTVVRVVGEQTLTELLDAYARRADKPRALEADIFSHAKFGPIARNIIKLWYVGVWYGLPPEWTESFGARENDGTFTASSGAYPEGLLWRAIGANPPGARAPGYGAWAHAPVIPPIPGDEPANMSVAALADAQSDAQSHADVPRPRGPQPQQAKETAQ